MTTPDRKARTKSARLTAEELGDRVMPAGILAVGNDGGTVAAVRTFLDSDDNGTYETLAGEMNPFGGFAGGVRVATGDFNGDGNAELVTAMGTGGDTVKIWALNSDGTVGALLDTLQPFGAGYTGGLFVAAGDTNNDGKDELAVSMGAGGNGVKVYSDTNGNGLVFDNLVDSFNPFGAFAGGSRVAFGNTNNTGGAELIVGKGPGADPRVKVYTDSDADRAVSDNAIVESFQAFNPAFTGGVYVAAGAIANAGTGGAEIIVGKDVGNSAVRIFSDVNGNGRVGDEPVFDAFKANGVGVPGGARVAAGDTDNSGSLVEVITGGGPGAAGGRLTIRDDNADVGPLLSDNAADDDFQAFGPGYTGGLYVAFGKVVGSTHGSTGTSPIPDLGSVTSGIVVPTGAGKITDVIVNLTIAHTFNADLDVTLTHVPSGKSVVLFTDVGGNSDGFTVRLSDAAATDIGTASAPNGSPITGTFNPEGAALLSIFDGLDASGEWQLTITDDTGADVGTLFGWSLEFRY